MRLKYILPAIFMLLAKTTLAQDIGLKIGDRLPDFAITKLINTAEKTINTSNFNDRLLIIDFWATNCSGCVAALPKMEGLQKQFTGKIKILPVTYEDQTFVSAFWKSNNYTKNLSLPSVVEDKIFANYFKHKGVPHEVWVYKGVVIAITAADYVNADNVQKVISGEKINWPVKDDFYVFDGTKEPLFIVDPHQADPASVKKYAGLSDYREGVSSSGLMGGAGIVRSANTKTVRVFIVNASIFNAYRTNLMAGIKSGSLTKPSSIIIAPNEIIWEVADRSKYTFDPKMGYEQQWVRDNAICYESVNPDTGQSDLKIRREIINDLNRLLGLHVRWEKRKEKVLVLVRSGKGKPVKETAAGTSFTDLAYQMNQQEEGTYVFDETNFAQGAIPIKIANYKSIESIKKAIAQYGVMLKEEERLVDKLVFTEENERLIINGAMATAAKTRRDAQAGQKQPDAAEGKAFLEANRKKTDIITLPSGLQYQVIKAGSGVKPTLNDRVKVNYTGMLVNGKIFESSLETGRPAEFSVDGVIEGWKQALELMPVGSKWMLCIPSALAYGEHTSNGNIPPYSTLVFELELLQIIK